METKKALLSALAAMKTEAESFEMWIDTPKRVGSGDYERWGPRDLIAHTAEWTRMLVLRLQGKEDESSDGSGHSGDLNRVLFERHGNSEWEEIVGMLKECLVAVEAESMKRSDSQLTEPDPGSADRPAWWAIAFYGIVHNLTHIGQALVRSGCGDQALELFKRMEPLLLQIGDLDSWKGMIAYNVGRMYVLTGDQVTAVEHIRKAIKYMPGAAKWIQNDEDFEEIRGAFK